MVNAMVLDLWISKTLAMEDEVFLGTEPIDRAFYNIMKKVYTAIHVEKGLGGQISVMMTEKKEDLPSDQT